MASENRTTYICGICNTSPDQLSHHNAHLKSITHNEQKIICEYNIRKYIVEFFYLLNDDYWKISLQNEYFDARMCCENETIPLFEDWIIQKDYEIYKKYKLNINTDNNYWVSKYTEETNHNCDLNDNINKVLFLDWKIKFLIKNAETIRKTERTDKKQYFDNEIINKINKNEITSVEIFNKFINELCINEGTECPHIQITGNINTTLNKHKKCNTNEINLAYVIYSNFKDKFLHKSLEVETIILGKSTKTKRSFWFINGEETNENQTSKIISIMKSFINEQLHNSSLENEKKLKITLLQKRLFTPSSLFLSKLSLLFTPVSL